MGFLTELADLASGGLAKQVFDTIKTYFPPSMSPEQQAAVQLELENIELKRSKDANDAVNEAEKNVNERIAAYEGTASDLKSVPFLGAFMLFLRGAFRPLASYATMYYDFLWFSGVWHIEDNMQRNTLMLINALVLGFFFGERAVKNVAPAIAQFMAAKNS
jgi:hypothetical protein